MSNIDEAIQRGNFEKFLNSEAWDKAKENEQKDKEEWERLSSFDAYKGQFYNVVKENGFDATHVENFDAVANVVSEYMRNQTCCRWASGEATRQKFDVPKRPKVGLLFMGAPGTGKTMLAGIIKNLTGIKMYRLRDVAQSFQKGGFEGIQTDAPGIYSDDVVLDDFGIQEERKYFGQGGYVDDIVFQRYDAWQTTKKLTIMTTNYVSFRPIPEKEIKGMRNDFSNQVMTRIEEMFLPVMFQGGCKRETAVKKFSQYLKPDYNGNN